MTYGDAYIQLADWRSWPSDPGIEYPTPKAEEAARTLLLLAEANGMAEPARLVADGVGGIYVHWRTITREWTMHVWDDGTMMVGSGEVSKKGGD